MRGFFSELKDSPELTESGSIFFLDLEDLREVEESGSLFFFELDESISSTFPILSSVLDQAD